MLFCTQCHSAPNVILSEAKDLRDHKGRFFAAEAAQNDDAAEAAQNDDAAEAAQNDSSNIP